MLSPKRILLFFLVLHFGVIIFLNIPSQIAENKMNNQMAAFFADSTTEELRQRTKREECEYRGGLPDSECTPGAVFSDATKDKVCVSGYSKKVRNVSVSLKKDVYKSYNVSYPQKTGSYEADHVIPLAIGGNNSIANLFPQPAEPYPGFREKDIVEMYLREEVCEGRVELGAAQRAIAADWLRIYNNIPADTVRRLRLKFRNWSN